MTGQQLPTIIVGAGLAGLSCARYLHDAGAPFVVLEAADAVGGRVRTDEIDGFKCDRGFQVLLTAYPEAMKQLDYESLNLKPFIAGSLIRKGGRFHRFIDPWRHPFDGIKSAFGGVGSLFDKARIAKLRSRSTRSTIESLFEEDESTTLDALRGYGFSESMIDGFFRPFLGGVFLERDLQTSSRVLHFVFRMFSQGSAALPSAGMQAIPEQMAARLGDGNVRLKSEVAEMTATSVGLTNGEQIEASQVVLATDAFSASKILKTTEPKPDRRVFCLYFAADETPVSDPILVLNGDGNGPINNLCVPTFVSPDYAPAGQHLVSVSVLEHSATDLSTLEDAVRKQACEWFGSAVDTWRHLKTYDIPHALPDQLVGKNATPGRSTSQDGIIVCGDHIGNASIQSALESGKHAAEQILNTSSSAAVA
ncbi:MAG: NAD(P)/FAD-dependent oxidoreductase [Planctomycetaceae bacterium]